MVIVWRRTSGDPAALAAFSAPAASPGCARDEPACVHAAERAAGDAAAWGARAALLVGGPGVGKSSFMRRTAAAALAAAATAGHPRWVVFVQLVAYSDASGLLEAMPRPGALSVDDLEQLLAAAAGVTAPNAVAARSFLSSALRETGAMSVFIDGFDEICPSFKEKVLRLLEILLQQTKAASVWVSSRPEAEASLQRVLQCYSTTLNPISSAEQRRFLSSQWTSQERLSEQEFAEAVERTIEAYLPGAHDATAGGGLLAAPLHLQMMAEIFTHALATELLDNKKSMTLVDLFNEFIERKERVFLEKHGFKGANVKNSSLHPHFMEIHQKCAMSKLVAERQPKCNDAQKILDYVAEHKEALQREKTGLLWAEWADQHLNVRFLHYTFVEFFAASWLSENIDEKELARTMVCEIYQTKLHGNMSEFLFWMFSKDCPLHHAVYNGKWNAFKKELKGGEQVDGIDGLGRTALHFAVLHVNTIFTKELIRNGCAINVREDLFSFTPLEYIGLYFENSSKDELVYRNVMDQLQLLLKAGAEDTKLPFVADHMEGFIHGIIHYGYEYPKVMELLLKHGISKCDYVGILHEAEKNNKTQTLRVLLSKLPSSEHKECLVDAMHVADEKFFHACCGHIRKTIETFEHDSENDVKENYGTSLHYLALEGEMEALKNALSSRMDVDEEYPFGVSPLHVAVYKGKLQCTEILLDNGYSVNSPDSLGFTPLHIAVERGNEEMLNLLLKKEDRDVNVQTTSGNFSPLHLAVIFDHVGCLKLLQQFNCDPNICDSYGFTALHIATAMSPTSIVKELLNMGSDSTKMTKQGSSSLHLTALSDNEESARLLLGDGKKLSDEDASKLTHFAASHGSLKIMPIIFEFKHDTSSQFSLQTAVNKQDAKHFTPLHKAVENGDDKTVKKLLESGADVNAKTDTGTTPLCLAAWKSERKCLDLLLEEQADVNESSNNGLTALHFATEDGDLSIIRRLVNAGALVNAKSHDGLTPLTHAAFEDQWDCVDELLQNPNIRVDEAGENCITPLHHAAQWGSVCFAEKLLKAGANVNATSKEGKTPLIFAASEGKSECVKLLLRSGGDANIPDESGFTPHHYAVQKNHLEVVKALESFCPHEAM